MINRHSSIKAFDFNRIIKRRFTIITLEKVIHVFQELLEEDLTIEIITLKQGYFVVSWQPRILRYDFSP